MARASANLFHTATPVPNWTEEDVKAWLQAVGFDQLAHVCEEHGIDGTVLMHLDSESLRDLGFIKVGQRLRLMRLINELLGLADNFDVLDSHSKLMGDQLNSECNLWHSVHSQNDRIRVLEDQVWNLKETTKFLRERTDSLTSYNTSWAMQSCPTSLTLQSSKPSGDSGTSTPPTTASSIRTAITCITSNHSRAHDTISNETDSAVERFTPIKYHDSTESTTTGMDHFSLASPMQRSKKHTPTRPSTPESVVEKLYNDASSSSSSKTPQPGISPQSAAFSPKTLMSKKSYHTRRSSQQPPHNLTELRGKFSGLNVDEPPLPSNTPTTPNGTALTANRKALLVNRRVGAPAQGQGIGSYSMRSGGALSDNRSGGVWKRSSSTTMLSGFPLAEPGQSKPHLSPKLETHSLNMTAINRSASTSNLKATNNSSDPRINQTLRRLNTETSMRVKSNTEQTVIEVLSNHLSAFYADEPHAWSKHVLLLRINDGKEYCLSYDDIPLKVYRSFRSREGVDFAIRSIDEIPSPLKLTGNSRRKNLSFNLEEELLTPDDSKSGPDGEIKKTELESKPLAYGLAICGYQATAPGELTIKAGESFKLRSHCKGRYYLERESNSSLASPLLGASGTPAPSPTRFLNETAIENVGWVAESCILESTQSMRTVSGTGSSLKHLISSPLDGATQCFDLENMTTPKIALVSFQPQPTTWSGELSKVVQGERVLVFNHKTRFHWVYCLRESSGERGWLPKWILSGNLDVFPDPSSSALHNKLQSYLLQQQSSARGMEKSGSETSSLELNLNRKAVMLGRSASTVVPQKHGSPPALRTLRTQRSQHYTPAGVPISIETPLKQQFISRNRPDPASEDGSDSGSSVLTRSVTDGASRAVNFTPRSRRSRIAS